MVNRVIEDIYKAVIECRDIVFVGEDIEIDQLLLLDWVHVLAREEEFAGIEPISE